jgi:hypothetical protein
MKEFKDNPTLNLFPGKDALGNPRVSYDHDGVFTHIVGYWDKPEMHLIIQKLINYGEFTVEDFTWTSKS